MPLHQRYDQHRTAPPATPHSTLCRQLHAPLQHRPARPPRALRDGSPLPSPAKSNSSAGHARRNSISSPRPTPHGRISAPSGASQFHPLSHPVTSTEDPHTAVTSTKRSAAVRSLPSKSHNPQPTQKCNTPKRSRLDGRDRLSSHGECLVNTGQAALLRASAFVVDTCTSSPASLPPASGPHPTHDRPR